MVTMELPFSSPVAGSKLGSRLLPFAIHLDLCTVVLKLLPASDEHSGDANAGSFRQDGFSYLFIHSVNKQLWLKDSPQTLQIFLSPALQSDSFHQFPLPLPFPSQAELPPFFFLPLASPPDKFVAYYCRLNNAP